VPLVLIGCRASGFGFVICEPCRCIQPSRAIPSSRAISSSSVTPGFATHLQPSEGEQVVFLNRLDVYHKFTDSGELQYKSRRKKKAIWWLVAPPAREGSYLRLIDGCITQL